MSAVEDLLASLTPQERRALLARLDGGQASRGSRDAAAGDEMRDAIQRRARSEAPLSYAQRGLWFLHHLRPEDTAYHVCYTIDWAGELDLAALGAALDDLTGRHEILRTVFPAIDGEPRQVILPSQRVPVSEVSLASDDGAGLAKWTQSAATQPFDLSCGPLLRALVIRRGDRHTLMLAVHHIIFDSRSMEILLDELVRFYDARATGGRADLPPLPVQFADFAVWQRERLDGPALDADRAYWRAKLDGARALALPADRQRCRVPQSAGSARTFAVADQLRTRLVALARQQDATLFMVLLAGFVALLHRYTGTGDIAVGTSVTTRDRPETENLIGYFLNTLVLRTELPGEVTFRGLVELVKGTVLDAFEHKDMPFEQLVEELAPERPPGALPLVPVLFAFTGTRLSRPAGPASGLTQRGVTNQGARADLTLLFMERPGGLAGAVEYDLGLFDADTIERFCGHLLRLLESGTEQPDTMVGRLRFITDAESDELSRLNATTRPAFETTTLTQMVASQARRRPARTAVSDDSVRISYAELDERSDRVARWLRGAGVGGGRPVGVLMPRGVDQVIALAGVLRAGGAYLPLDPGYPAERLAFMAADAGADVLITLSQLTPQLTPQLAATTDGNERRILIIDRPWQPPPGVPDAWTEPVHPDQPAYILYTSGSTGRPKGVVNTHRGLINRLGWMREAFGAGQADVIAYKTPMSFDVSLWELVLPFMCGAEMVVARPDGHMDPGYLTDLIERRGVTMIHFVPSMLQAFLAAADPARCRSLRQVLCSGEALTAALRDQFFAAGFTAALDNLYGPTEAAIDVTRWPCAAGQPGEVPIGYPIMNTQAYLLDGNGEQLPTGIPGELWLGGDQLALGYLSRPGLTAASFAPDPFHPGPGRRIYRTGDIARRRRDGAIEYLGRQDQQVKLRGHRIELPEVEVALRSHESVSDAVVLLAGPAGDARLVAYVVPKGPVLTNSVLTNSVLTNSVLTNSGLREHLGRVLPGYMVPASYAFVDAIPLTANGKADRNALRAITPEAVRATEYVEPRDDIEVAVAGLFAELTGTPRVSLHDDFFEIGGHSLLALRLRARLVGEFGIDMPLRDIFDDPTVEGVADKIVGQIMRCVDAAETEQAPGSGS